MRSIRILSLVGGVATTVALAALSSTPAFASDEMSGSAFAVSAGATLLNSVKADLPPLPTATYPEGARKSVVSVNDVQHHVVRAKLLNASSRMQDGALRSAASIADVEALNDLLKAKLIEAKCTTDSSGTKGSSALVDASLAGHPLTVNGPQEIDLAGGIRVRTNEQINDGHRLTVDAVHIIVGGPVADVARADIVLGQAACSLASGPVRTTTPPPTTSTAKPTTTKPTSSNPAVPGIPTNSGPGAGGSKKLANTGLSEALPFVGGAGLALLALSGGALYWTRRRNSSKV